jgi:hypothetical protein
MDSLLESGQYRDYGELVSGAVENLWVLDREVMANGALIIEEGKAARHMESVPSVSRPVKKVEVPVSEVRDASNQIPGLFGSQGLEHISVRMADIPAASVKTDDVFTLDRWLFGQYNKLLPAKANSRALLRLVEGKDLVEGKEKGASLEVVAAEIADAAGHLGDYLADLDENREASRDDALATAFPRSGADAEKSRSRYANQFVGSVNSQNVLSGLMWDYRLAGLVPGGEARLLPTKQGIEFARLANPVLDESQANPAQKFTEDEIEFLLKHIRTYVPAEAFAFKTLAQAIAGGADTPDKLDEALKSLVPKGRDKVLSPSFLTSQRSGALSRMADLGLIKRKRAGVTVTYVMTDRGKSLT